ncbi:hypothetical protein HanRHA438_Chr12g0533021 [Helianthus annuus]|nr:hypothetical protein HanRHA438_Chr12g0533021 [Helianthus annuus]
MFQNARAPPPGAFFFKKWVGTCKIKQRMKISLANHRYPFLFAQYLFLRFLFINLVFYTPFNIMPHNVHIPTTLILEKTSHNAPLLIEPPHDG